MAYDYATLVKQTNPVLTGPVDVTTANIAEMQLPADKINGITMKVRVMDTLPGAAFRDLGAGKDGSGVGYNVLVFDTKLIDASFNVDLGYIQGEVANGSSEDVIMARSMNMQYKSAMQGAVNALYYGDGETELVALADQDGIQTYDAEGTVTPCSMTTGLTSAYLVRAGEEDFRWIVGNGGFAVSDAPYKTLATDGNGKPFDAMRMSCLGWIGYAYSNPASIIRVANLSAGKPLTDDIIYAAYAMAPADAKPTHLIVNNKQLELWRQSRTAVSPTGAPADLPKEVAGMKVIVSGALVNDEAAYSAE